MTCEEKKPFFRGATYPIPHKVITLYSNRRKPTGLNISFCCRVLEAQKVACVPDALDLPHPIDARDEVV